MQTTRHRNKLGMYTAAGTKQTDTLAIIRQKKHYTKWPDINKTTILHIKTLHFGVNERKIGFNYLQAYYFRQLN